MTLRKTALVLQENITIAKKPLKDHLEAIGYRDAFQYIFQLTDRKKELTENTIKTIHSLVLMNDWENRGSYRHLPVCIPGSDEHTPPQPYLVPLEMEKLLADYPAMKQEHHIIEAIALFHVRFLRASTLS